MKVLRTIARLYRSYKPLGFFSAFALLLTIVSTIFIIPVLITYARTGLVPNFPTLIVCGFVYLTAIISFFAGLILSSIVHQERQNFEIRLIACQHRYDQTLDHDADSRQTVQ